MTRQKNEIANGMRLENASWRTWWKQRNKLKTVNPETLNWSVAVCVLLFLRFLTFPPPLFTSHCLAAFKAQRFRCNLALRSFTYGGRVDSTTEAPSRPS
ncbi:hypothetical protein L218DRAFT_851834 [Marasmius fiardii PR-910]|nr:hypothetical protein L218DRAFT_851834 [Marasmius fiardii PR-910]